jgi:hypothetical protein
MAQVVIFAPPGEDVSAGEQALKDAGHEVEVVEATPVNLLHMAVGMMDEEAPTEEPPADEAPAEEPPADEAPAEEMPAEEEPTTEAIGEVSVDGEKVTAYLDRSYSFPLLRVVDLTGDDKITYKLAENTYTFWREEAGLRTNMQLSAKFGRMCEVNMGRAARRPHIILDAVTAKHLGLV